MRAAVADHRPHRNDRGLVLHRLGRFNRLGDRIQIVAVGHLLHMPVIGLESLLHVLGERQLRRPVERDQVVVVEEDQLAQSQRTGKRGRFVRDAFHQVAVAADAVGVVIDNVEAGLVVDRGQMLLRDAHSPTDMARPCPSGPVVTSTPSVSPRSGCPGVIDSHCRNCCRSSMRHLVAGQVQHAVQQRRSMPVRKHKAVAVRPVRVRRIVPHVLVEEQVRNRSVAQRRARVAALGLVHGVYSKKTKCINRKLIDIAHNLFTLHEIFGP